jgi:hypothetical protein
MSGSDVRLGRNVGQAGFDPVHTPAEVVMALTDSSGSPGRTGRRRRALIGSLAVTALAGFLVGELVAFSIGTASAAPAVAPPALGREHAVSPTERQRPEYGSSPAVAFDGTNHLVVWEQNGIRAALVGPSGELLDRTPILVASGPAYNYNNNPKVAFDGTNYLVVWGTDGYIGPSDIRATRVSTGGEVLDPGGLLIAGTPATEILPAVGFDGTNYLIAWNIHEGFDDGTVQATRVDRNGAVLDAPRTIPGPRFPGPLVFDGANYLFTWTDANGLQAARLSRAGAVLAPGAFRLSATATVNGMGVAFDGVNWHAVWAEPTTPGGPSDIYGTRISPAGVVLDPAPFPISRAASDETAPTAARVGDRVLVTWSDARGEVDAYGARVSRAGVVLDPTPFAVATGPGEQRPAAAVAGGSRVLVTIGATLRDFCCTVQAVRVTGAGGVLDPSPRQVSYRANGQYNPRMAYDGTNHLVAWNDDRDVDGGSWGGVHVARVTPAGVSLDPDGIRVSAVDRDYLSDVAFDGRNYLVAIQRLSYPDGVNEQWDVYVAIVGRDGRLITPTPLPIGTGPGWDLDLSLSPDGTNTLAVWSSASGGGVVGARISPAGDVLAPGVFRISSSDELHAGRPSAAFDGTNHLVVYDRSLSDNSTSDVVARRVSAAGQVIDSTARPVATTPDHESNASVAWSGRCYFVVWGSSDQGGGGRRQVRGARVGRTGDVLAPGPLAISTGIEDQTIPSVASLNGWFLVTWNREREPYPTGRWDLLGARVHESGELRDPGGFLIAEEAVAADVAAGGDGRWRTTYRRPNDPGTGADRVFIRTVAPK